VLLLVYRNLGAASPAGAAAFRCGRCWRMGF
jgi:hypothetical protein